MRRVLLCPGDSLRFHSHFACTVIEDPHKPIAPLSLVSYGRLATAVKKSHLLACWDNRTQTVRFLSLEWAGMGWMFATSWRALIFPWHKLLDRYPLVPLSLRLRRSTPRIEQMLMPYVPLMSTIHKHAPIILAVVLPVKLFFSSSMSPIVVLTYVRS
jgi:hypothetical protein